MMNYANLFWLFGHPEVYILILPAFGVYSEVVSTFSTKELYGYTSLVLATAVIALLSFTVWVHHFFTMGQNADINAVFGIATMTIGVPTGVKIYDWIWTMFRGEVRFTVPMLYSLAFMMTFVLGGFTGILLAFRRSIIWFTTRCFLSRISTTCLTRGCFMGCSRLPLLVSQGFRFSAQREMGPHLVQLLGRRVLSRLHAALSAWRGGRGTASKGCSILYSAPGSILRASVH